MARACLGEMSCRCTEILGLGGAAPLRRVLRACVAGAICYTPVESACQCGARAARPLRSFSAFGWWCQNPPAPLGAQAVAMRCQIWSQHAHSFTNLPWLPRHVVSCIPL